MRTKQRILDVSLDLFSRRGFEAVSVRDIAAAVSVKEGALYRHFSSKRAVLDALIAHYRAQSAEYMASIHAQPTGDAADLAQGAAFYASLDDEGFLRIALRLFTDFMMRPDVMRFWRVVSIEQYHDPAMAALWDSMLFEEPIAFQTALFGILIAHGALRPVDPALLAVEFFTPALMMYLRLLPWMEDAQRTAESLAFFERHILHFRRTYAPVTEKSSLKSGNGD